MPALEDLPKHVQGYFRTLFTPANFCFFTYSLERTPTLYFAQGGKPQLSKAALCGRLRTQHAHGPLIDVTTMSKRHFFFAEESRLDLVTAVLSGTSNDQRTNGHARFFMRLVGYRYGTDPVEGHYHFEFTALDPKTVARRHRSTGVVFLSPRPTEQDIDSGVDDLLAMNCRVELNGVSCI